MGVLTTFLKLLKPSENDYYNQQTEQADNWQKVDDYAVLTNADKNGIWGGEFGGYIQDPIPKELNKRYIDNINGKAFICIKAGDSSVVSNTIEYFTPCNVVDNLEELQNLSVGNSFVTPRSGFNLSVSEAPSVFSNRANFTIGTGGGKNSVGTILGTSTLKPKKNIMVIATQFVNNVGCIGSLVIEFKTTGEIVVQSNGGTSPGYTNSSNSSYYVTFDFEFIQN